MDSTYPQDEGWKLGEEAVRLSQITISRQTKFRSRESSPPNCEAKWAEVLQDPNIPWLKIWRSIGCIFTSPRDEKTWLLLLHRALRLRGRDSREPDRTCRMGCRTRESQLHLLHCRYLEPLRQAALDILRAMGITPGGCNFNTNSHQFWLFCCNKNWQSSSPCAMSWCN